VPAAATTPTLGLPPHIAACLFDLDGVITQTATVHAQAWKQTLDPISPFDPVKDYDEYVDGKPRVEGIRSFLAGRHITLPEEQVQDLAERKDHLFLDLIHEHGVQTYDSSEVLRAAALDHFFDAQVDGNVAEKEHLQGKPAPDTYVRAAQMLRTPPEDSAVYEDALAGVEAGHAGHFGLVVGIDRAGQAEALRSHGADVVVRDLEELLQPA